MITRPVCRTVKRPGLLIGNLACHDIGIPVGKGIDHANNAGCITCSGCHFVHHKHLPVFSRPAVGLVCMFDKIADNCRIGLTGRPPPFNGRIDPVELAKGLKNFRRTKANRLAQITFLKIDHRNTRQTANGRCPQFGLFLAGRFFENTVPVKIKHAVAAFGGTCSDTAKNNRQKGSQG